MPSTTSTSQSPGCDCSMSDSAVPVPSYSLRLTRTSCAFSNGSISAGSVWSHHTSAFSSPSAAAGPAATSASAEAPSTSRLFPIVVFMSFPWSVWNGRPALSRAVVGDCQ